MTGARFRDYVTTVLVPVLRPGDTVVLDNLPCRTAAAVRAAVEAAGCRLLYLPPYSPDLNPIELASPGSSDCSGRTGTELSRHSSPSWSRSDPRFGRTNVARTSATAGTASRQLHRHRNDTSFR